MFWIKFLTIFEDFGDTNFFGAFKYRQQLTQILNLFYNKISFGNQEKAAIDAVAQLLDHFERRKYVNRDCYEFSGHRDHGSTVCPGDPLYHLWSQSYDNWHQEC